MMVVVEAVQLQQVKEVQELVMVEQEQQIAFQEVHYHTREVEAEVHIQGQPVGLVE
jgi:hypothetical protein